MEPFTPLKGFRWHEAIIQGRSGQSERKCSGHLQYLANRVWKCYICYSRKTVIVHEQCYKLRHVLLQQFILNQHNERQRCSRARTSISSRTDFHAGQSRSLRLRTWSLPYKWNSGTWSTKWKLTKWRFARVIATARRYYSVRPQLEIWILTI